LENQVERRTDQGPQPDVLDPGNAGAGIAFNELKATLTQGGAFFWGPTAGEQLHVESTSLKLYFEK
jgi:hypothetical protein